MPLPAPGTVSGSFSETAMDASNNRNTSVPNWYMGVPLVHKYREGATRVYHHT